MFSLNPGTEFLYITHSRASLCGITATCIGGWLYRWGMG